MDLASSLVHEVFDLAPTMISNSQHRVGNVRWTVEHSTTRFLGEHMDNMFWNHSPAPSSSPGTNSTDESDTRVVYQMKHLLNEDLPWRMGAAPSQAQRDDLACWVSGILNAILVMMHGAELECKLQRKNSARLLDRVTRLAQRTTYDGKPVLSFPITVHAWTLSALLAD